MLQENLLRPPVVALQPLAPLLKSDRVDRALRVSCIKGEDIFSLSQRRWQSTYAYGTKSIAMLGLEAGSGRSTPQCPHPLRNPCRSSPVTKDSPLSLSTAQISGRLYPP